MAIAIELNCAIWRWRIFHGAPRSRATISFVLQNIYRFLDLNNTFFKKLCQLHYNVTSLIFWKRDNMTSFFMKMIISREVSVFSIDQNPNQFFLILKPADYQLSYPKFLTLRRSYNLVMNIHGRMCLNEFIRDEGRNYSLIYKAKHISNQHLFSEETTTLINLLTTTSMY